MTSRITAAVAVAMLAACGGLLGLSDYEVNPDCVDESGAFGRGCFKCPPSTDEQLLNSCGRCFEYNNDEKIRKFDSPPAEVCDAGVKDTGGSADSGAVDADADAAPLPRCSDEKNPIYMTGSSALNLVWPSVVGAVSAEATIIYKQEVSCFGVDAITKGEPMKGTAAVLKPDVDVKAAPLCQLGAEGVQADIGLSDLPHSACPDPVTDTSGFIDEDGPIQVFMFAVPRVDTAPKAISAEAAQRVFELGAAGSVEPYDRCDLIIRRSEESGTQRVLAEFLRLDPAKFAGTGVSGSSEVVNRLRTAMPPEKAICITSSDVAEDDSGGSSAPGKVMRTLAYQHFGQTCAFLPDKVLDSHDKFNVRTGRYALWAPVHMLRRVTDQRPIVRDVMKFVAGRGDLGTLKVSDHIKSVKAGRLVPQCAMQVTRDFTKGVASPMRPFKPDVPCGCGYEFAEPAAGETTCKECESNKDCTDPAAPVCLFGGCEAAR